MAVVWCWWCGRMHPKKGSSIVLSINNSCSTTTTTMSFPLYNDQKTPFQNMEMLHESISYPNKWAMYGTLKLMYELEHEVEKVIVSRSVPWEVLTMSYDKWYITQEDLDFCYKFKNSYTTHISYEEFESYVFCKLYLQTLLEESVCTFSMITAQYKGVDIFLSALDLLYKQKFNATQIKVLFYPLFYDHVISDIADSTVHFDIIHALASMIVTTTIKMVKLKPYIEYIKKHTPKSECQTICEVMGKKFNSGECLDVLRFYNYCKVLHDESVKFKKSPTINNLRKLFHKNEFVGYLCNSLNKNAGNVLLVALFKQKESNITFHDQLYNTLRTIIKLI